MGNTGRGGCSDEERAGQYWDIQYSPAPHTGNYARARCMTGQERDCDGTLKKRPLERATATRSMSGVCGASKERGSDNHAPFWDAGAEARNDDLPVGRLHMPSSSLLPPSWSWPCSWAPGVSFQAPSAGGRSAGAPAGQGVWGGLLPERGSRRGSPDVEILPAWTRRGARGHTLACLDLLAPVPWDVTDGLFSHPRCAGFLAARVGDGGGWQMTCGVKYWFLGGRMGYSKGPSPRVSSASVKASRAWRCMRAAFGPPRRARATILRLQLAGVGRQDGNVMSGVHVQVAGHGGNLALLSRLLDISPGPRATRHTDRAKFPVTHTSIGPPK